MPGERSVMKTPLIGDIPSQEGDMVVFDDRNLSKTHTCQPRRGEQFVLFMSHCTTIRLCDPSPLLPGETK